MNWFNLVIICLIGILLTQIKAWNNEKSAFSTRTLTKDHPGFGEFSWLVQIHRKNSDKICAGALISSRWVLSSRFCLYFQNLRNLRKTYSEYIVTCGTAAINENFPEMGSVAVTGDFAICKDYETDLGLLKLASNVYENEFVKYIRLAKKSTEALRNTTALYTTWNTFAPEKSRIKHYEMNLISNEECAKFFGLKEIERSSHLCTLTSVPSPELDDETRGGTLVTIGDDGIPTIIGVATFRPETPIRSSRILRGFARVSEYAEWINKETGISF